MSETPTAAPPSKEDKELLELLTKLYAIQENVGSKPKTSAQDKRARAENSAMLGRGRAAKKVGSRFMELKSTVVDRLKTIHGLLEEEQERNRATSFSIMGKNSPKEVIARQAQIREELRQANDEWTELNGLYTNEARKKRSKFSKEQLDTQQTLVQRLKAEIDKVQDIQRKGFARGGNDDVAAELNTQALINMDFDTNAQEAGSSWAGTVSGAGQSTGGGVELTQQQHVQLQQIQSRDEDFDKQLVDIGEGIQDLAEIAQLQNEEVRRQNTMLDNVGKKIDDAHDHIANVNTKMKETLDEVRSADKICVDIMCIVLMFGLGAVLYQMIKSNS